MTVLPSPDTITTAAAALRQGRASSAALIEISLAAIAADGAATNAFIQVDEAGARAAARQADREREEGRLRSALHGIPISVKDLIDVAGVVTTAGSKVLRDRIAPASASVIGRLSQAGAIIIGRTNLHEFALGTTSEDSAFGPVRHPRDRNRSAGGSSGGSAVAVTLGMGFASVGTDTGGSIRIPAAACGIVGLKPGAGEIPLDGVVPLSPSLDHVGPLTRTVEDAATMYAVMAGLGPFVLVAPAASGIRVAWLDGYFAQPVQPAVRDAMDHVAQRLTHAGVRIRPAVISGTESIVTTYVDIVLPEAARWHGRLLDTHADEYTPPVRQRLLQGRSIAAVAYLEAQANRERLRSAVDVALNEADVLALPTLPLVAPILGTEMVALERGGADVPVRTAMLKHTQLFNLTGHPAISLPIGGLASLPVGIQLVGRRGETRHLLEIAFGLERIVACP